MECMVNGNWGEKTLREDSSCSFSQPDRAVNIRCCGAFNFCILAALRTI